MQPSLISGQAVAAEAISRDGIRVSLSLAYGVAAPEPARGLFRRRGRDRRPMVAQLVNDLARGCLPRFDLETLMGEAHRLEHTVGEALARPLELLEMELVYLHVIDLHDDSGVVAAFGRARAAALSERASAEEADANRRAASHRAQAERDIRIERARARSEGAREHAARQAEIWSAESEAAQARHRAESAARTVAAREAGAARRAAYEAALEAVELRTRFTQARLHADVILPAHAAAYRRALAEDRDPPILIADWARSAAGASDEGGRPKTRTGNRPDPHVTRSGSTGMRPVHPNPIGGRRRLEDEGRRRRD